ncbi:putative phytanoyl-CoA dioxygenase [Exophiala viscosa]|nr:putative phytanoyl-CoA dioxygenase [Exophiala viscosa]
MATTTGVTSRAPAVVRASEAEVGAGRFFERNLEVAVRHVLKDGVVVIQDAINHQVLDKLNEKMKADAITLSKSGDGTPFNYNRGNLQQDAPPVRKFFDPSIFLNPLATHVTASVLGPRPKLTFMSGNTAMPATDDTPSQRQPVHADSDFRHPSHPFALVVNVGLTDMNPNNGSTEIWLGTHNDTSIDDQEGSHGERASGRIKEDLLEERRAILPPLQPTIPKGSIIIRDLRLWHAGMPNLSSDIRVMLAMIHFAPWYRNPMRLELGEGIRPVIEAEKDLDVRADYVPEELALSRYLNRGFGNSYDFNQTP